MDRLNYIQNINNIIKINYSDDICKLCKKYLKNLHKLHDDEIITDFSKFKKDICSLLDKSIEENYNLKDLKNIDYDEIWALEKNNYISEEISKEILDERKDMINRIYLIYNKYSILDNYILNPDEWSNPPQYCYYEQLKVNLKEYEDEYLYAKKQSIQKIKNIINKEYKYTSIEDDLYMDHFY